MIPVPKTLEEAIQIIQQLVEKIAKIEAESAAREAALQARIAELEARLAKYEGKPPTDPNTPSGMTPPYLKPGKKKSKKPGRKHGHAGVRREPPQNVNNHVHHALFNCPGCGAAVDRKSVTTRKRYTEDIPARVEPEATEHTIERGWCSSCRKFVEAPVPEALPRCSLGLRVVLLAAFMHYGLGVAVHKVVSWLAAVHGLKVSAGGLTQAFARLGERLTPLYDAVWEEVKRSGVLWADETGWRVAGRTFWLWCFATKGAVLYVIDRSRASPVVLRVLGEVFHGVLISDFFGSYNAIVALAKQRCVVHLLRELKKVDLNNRSAEWRSFRRQLKRLIRDAVNLGRDRGLYGDAGYDRRWKRMHGRLSDLYSAGYTDCDCRRLSKRLSKHRDELFTFLEHDGVTADNNFAERAIRPAVQMRKAYYGNRSQSGAAAQAIFMTLFRTLELRGVDPVIHLEQSLRHMIEHGDLPSLVPYRQAA